MSFMEAQCYIQCVKSEIDGSGNIIVKNFLDSILEHEKTLAKDKINDVLKLLDEVI